MIKGNCAQSVVPRCGEKFNSFGLLRCPYWSILKMWLLLYWENYRPFFEMRLFWELWWPFFSGFWGRPTKRQRKMVLSEEWMRSWAKSVELCLVRRGRIIQLTSFPGYGIDRLFSWSNFSVSYSYTLLLQRAVTDAWMLLNLQSRTPRLLSFRDEPTLRRFCTHCGPMFLLRRQDGVY